MRTPIKPISQPELIRPVATPVNTYVRPADPAPSPLHELAQGLGDLAGGLSSMVQERDAKQQEADALKAEALFNENNQIGFSEAVRQGLIPAQASPAFVRAYKTAQGNLAGIQLQEKFNAEYMKWGGRNSNDPAAFNTFMSDFVKNNVDPNVDPDILRGLNPHVRQLWTQGHDVFSRDSDASLREGAKSTLGAIANRLADAADQQKDEKGVNWDGYWSDLMEERKKATDAGMRYEDADAALVTAVTQKAVSSGDMKWLDLLKREIPGRKGIKYEDLPDFKLAMAQAQDKISTDVRQANAERDRLTKEANEKEKDDLTAKIYKAISEDPNAEVPEEVIRRVETLGSPTIRKQMQEARTSFSDAAAQEDRSIVLELTRKAVNGELTLGGLQQAISSGQIKSAQTYKNLSDTLRQVAKERSQGGGILTDSVSKQAQQVVIERIIQNDKTIARAIGGEALSLPDEALEAQDEMRQLLLEWEMANPNATTIDRVDAVKKIRDLMLERVNPDKGTFQSSQDIANETLKVQQGQQLDATSGELDAAKRRQARDGQGQGDGTMLDSPAADREVNTLFQGDAPPDLEKVPKNYQKMIQDGADKLGISPKDLNERVWKRYLEKTGSSPAPQGEFEGLIEKGNIDLSNRPQVRMEDGSIATVRSASFNIDGQEVLIPTVSPDGKLLSDEEALRLYKETGQFLGKFDTQEHASAYAEELHKAQERYYRARNVLKKSSLENTYGGIMNASLDSGSGLDETQKARIAGAAKLLASFTGPEGTSVDGYDTTLGHGKFTGGKVNLTGMTLDQIDALQTDMLKHPDNNLNSSAVGQYQVVQTTLRSLRSEMGLTGQEVFDAKLQDQMGLALLDRRGYSKWLAGDMTDEQFVSNLRDEWDGLNKVSKSSLVSALQDVRDGGSSAFDAILTQKDQPQADYKGTGALRFAHADQEAGVKPELKATLEKVSEDMGEPLRITSGFRSSRHPVERRKGNGGGEHTHGNAVDIDMAGWDDAKRASLIRSLQAKGLKRFILYSNSPNMLHVDLKDQRGDGTSYFMFNKSAQNMGSAPRWYRELADELEQNRSV